jgi:hypothetical protein
MRIERLPSDVRVSRLGHQFQDQITAIVNRIVTVGFDRNITGPPMSSPKLISSIVSGGPRNGGSEIRGRLRTQWTRGWATWNNRLLRK